MPKHVHNQLIVLVLMSIHMPIGTCTYKNIQQDIIILYLAMYFSDREQRIHSIQTD